MTTHKRVLLIAATALLGAAGCRDHQDDEARWAEQPRETSAEPVTGKQICEKGQPATEDCEAE